jgi:hypothetical protein
VLCCKWLCEVIGTRPWLHLLFTSHTMTLRVLNTFAGATVVITLAAATTGVQAAPVTYVERVGYATQYPDGQVGLGARVFQGGNVRITLTLVGDTKDVYPYSVTAANGHVTKGYRIDKGVATVKIEDITNNVTVSATLLPGEVYVGTDISNGGVGFGSRIYPIYPYAVLTNGVADLSLATYNLTQNFQVDYYGISCVGYAAGNGCKNASPNGAQYPLHTDKGDFWVTAEGITGTSFITTVTPVPKVTIPKRRWAF